MRTIVVLLIVALVLTPTLAHAQSSGAGGLGIVAAVVLPVLLILLICRLTGHEVGGESPAVTFPAPADGSGR